MSLPIASPRPNPQAGASARRWAGGFTSVVAGVVLISGCTSSSSTPSGSNPSAGAGGSTAGSTTASRSTDPNTGLKNGTQLKAALLTKKDLPSGYKLSADLVRDTADVFGPQSSPAKQTTADCKKLVTNAWVDGAEVGSASFAQTGFSDGYGNEVDAEIDAFRGTDATLVMANMRKLFKLCSSFSSKTPGVAHTTVKLASKPGPKVGDDSVKAVLTSTSWQGGQTLAAVQVGKSVVTVLFSSSKKDLGAKAVDYAEKMAQRLG